MKKLLFLCLLFPAFSFSQKGYQVGDNASDFNLPAVNGQDVSLANYTNAKGFIVVFTCNHCPYAVKNEDRVNDLNRKYEPNGFPVIAINSTDTLQFPQDSFDKMRQRAQDKAFSFPYLVDGTQDVVKAYGATKTPHVYLLQKEGNSLVVKYTGAIDDNVEDASAVKEKYVENAVNALLAGKDVARTSTKSIGCSINLRK